MHSQHVYQLVMNATQKYEFGHHKEDIDVEKKELIMKRDQKNKEIMREKKHENKYKKKIFCSMKGFMKRPFK